MKLRTFTISIALVIVGGYAGGCVGVQALNWRLERGDRVHISYPATGAIVGSVGFLGVFGLGSALLNRRKARLEDASIDALEKEAHDQMSELQSSGDAQVALILALKRIRDKNRSLKS